MLRWKCVLFVFLTAGARLLAAAPSCAVQPMVPTFLRAESLAELLPDIVVQCTGGTANAQTSLDLTLFLATSITSRLIGTNSSEVLLLVNEPSPTALAIGQNAFLGTLAAINELSWTNVPVTFTGSGGLTLRLRNIRANANSLSFGPTTYGQSVQMLGEVQMALGGVSVTIPASVLSVGLVGSSVTTDARQCDDSGPSGTAVGGPGGLNTALFSGGTGQINFNLRFRELIPKGFSTQQSDTGATVAGMPGVGTATQGLELVAAFNDLPAGMEVYVTDGPVAPTDSPSASAALLSTGSGGSPVASATGVCPLTNAPAVPLYPVTLTSVGSGIAKWQITAADPTAFEQLSFGVALAGTGQMYSLPTVNLSLGPSPFLDGFSFSSAAQASASLPIPRFADESVAQTLSVVLVSNLSFVAVAGAGAVPHQFISASCSTPTVTTTSGGAWLLTSQLAGGLDVSVNPAGLAAGMYFGQILCGSSGALTVVLSVGATNNDPGPSINPIGLVFVVPQNTVSPVQNVTIYDLTNTPVGYQETERNLSGTATAGIPAVVSFQANTAGVSPGIYDYTFHYTFSDGYLAQVVVRLIVTAAAAGTAALAPMAQGASAAGATCPTPSSLTAVFQSVGQQLYFTTTYPVNLNVLVSDNCGAPVTAGAVTVAISGETKPVTMSPSTVTPGLWIGSWTPSSPQTGATLTVTAAVPNLPTATQTITRDVLGGGTAPVIFSGGIVNAATQHPPVALGGLITIYGSNLADTQYQPGTIALPTKLGNTFVTLAGGKLPLSFVGPGQINAMVPYNLAPGSYPIQVLNGSAVSNTAQVMIAGVAPGVFTTDASGTGQGAIESATTGAVADSANPVMPGDFIAAYVTGLGSVLPVVNAGDPAPQTPLSWVVGNSGVTATVGGLPASVTYAGLAPGFAGLYQVNIQVPAGAQPDGAVPVVISSGGVATPPVTIAVK